MAFEASSRKGLRKRYLIENIESHGKDSNSLFYYDDDSELVMQSEASSPVARPSSQSLAITAEGIGGLNKQILTLNKRLTRLIREARSRRSVSRIQRNGAILLYGPSGTGKSLLLHHLAEAQWQSVLYIDQSVLPGTTTKSQAAIRSTFAEAIAQQPSLIVMDDLHALAGIQQQDIVAGNLAQTLASELDKLKNTQVLVVAATSRPMDIDISLRNPDRFRYEIEIPIPDMRARIEILKVMHNVANDEHDAVAEAIGERTHGFVGRDLYALCTTAEDYADDRYDEDWVDVQASTNRNSDTTLVDHTGTIDQGPLHNTDTPRDIEVTLADYERALLDVRPTTMKEVFLETPKVLWSEIGGSEDVRVALEEVIEWPLKYQEEMELLNLTPQKGILLYGPPGCSKTLTAKAVATSSGLNFIAVKGAELTSMYVGESERAVREVFRKARAAAPSIIFFDEIESIGGKRSSEGTNGLNVLTTLLNEMDGIETLKGVLVLAATNQPELLDLALLRPGRFDSKIYIGPPNDAARREILNIQTKHVPLASDVDLDAVAAKTKGFSGAEVVNICLEAARATMRRRRNKATEGGDAIEAASLLVNNGDFEKAVMATVRSITPEVVQGYIRWRDGRV